MDYIGQMGCDRHQDCLPGYNVVEAWHAQLPNQKALSQTDIGHRHNAVGQEDVAAVQDRKLGQMCVQDWWHAID